MSVSNDRKGVAGRLLLVIFAIMLSGCMYSNNTLWHLNQSLSGKSYEQAAIRLERCAFSGPDQKACSEMLEKIKESGLPVAVALRQQHEEKLVEEEAEKERKRLAALRESADPWDKLSLAMEIQAGETEESFSSEANVLVEQAFFGFGECARQADPTCMTQYAQMILYGLNSLAEKERNEARRKAVYWLTLAARYGNENSRRILISLEEDIPSPDLAMENLQKIANSLTRDEIEARAEAERRQAYYQSQMLEETRRQNLLESMKYFFPKTVNCTTWGIGGNIYTSCR